MSSEAFKKALGNAVTEKAGAALPSIIVPLLDKYGITPESIREYAERVIGYVQSIETRLTIIQQQNDEILCAIRLSQTDLIPAGPTMLEEMVTSAIEHASNGEYHG